MRYAVTGCAVRADDSGASNDNVARWIAGS